MGKCCGVQAIEQNYSHYSGMAGLTVFERPGQPPRGKYQLSYDQFIKKY